MLDTVQRSAGPHRRFFVASSLRSGLSSALSLLLVLGTSYMVWKVLSIITRSSHPIVVVISESMAPAFHRGDILFLWNRNPVVRAGEIPVCWFPGRPLPMVHRAIKVFTQSAGEAAQRTAQWILTKGDNNDLDDTALYPVGQAFVYRDQVVGVVKGYLPYVGYITIALNESAWFRGVMIALLLTVGLLSS